VHQCSVTLLPGFIEWERAQSSLAIVASPEVAHATGPVIDAFGMMEDRLAPYSGDPEAPMHDFDEEKWARCSAALTAAIDGFTVAARTDLGA
jgi:hypothetical protein